MPDISAELLKMDVKFFFVGNRARVLETMPRISPYAAGLGRHAVATLAALTVLGASASLWAAEDTGAPASGDGDQPQAAPTSGEPPEAEGDAEEDAEGDDDSEQDGPDGDADSPYLVEHITIIGTPARIQDVPGSAQELSREDLERHSHADPHRVLRAIPGVSVIEEEGHGQFPHFSMRGAPPERNSRVTVMEDGVLIAPAPYAAPAAYYFPPIERMDAVEVQKGSSAIRHGPYTTGGAINMRSKPIPRETGAALDAILGSNNGRRVQGDVGSTHDLGAAGEIGWLAQGLTTQTDGFKSIDNPLAGPNQPELDAGLDRRNLMAKLRWNTNPGAGIFQSVELKYANDRRSMADTYLGLAQQDYDDTPFRRYAGSAQDEINTHNELFQARHFMNPLPRLDITTTLYRTDTVRNWYKLHEVAGDDQLDRTQSYMDQSEAFVGISSILDDPNASDNVANAFDWIRGQDTGVGALRANNREYYAQGADLRAGYHLDAGATSHNIEAGVRYHQDEEDRFQWHDFFEMRQGGHMSLIEREDPGGRTNRLTEASAIAAYAQNAATWGPLGVTAGLRFESIDIRRRDWDGPPRDSGNLARDEANTYDVFIPGVGATYEFLPGVSALAGVHRGFAPGGASPDGEAERSTNIEAGLRYSGDATRAEAIGFFNDYSNINIECTAVGGGCGEAEVGDVVPAGEVDIYGIEALVLHDLGASSGWDFGVPLSLGYTLTQSAFGQAIGGDAPNQWAGAQEGDPLPEIPAHEVNASAGVTHRDWQLHLTGNYVTAVQAKADPALSAQEIDARLLLDLAGSYSIHENVALFGSVENLTDQEYVAHYRPAGARPGKPREVWGGIKGQF